MKKHKEKLVVGTYLTKESHEWVSRTAAKENRNMSSQVAQLIQEARAARESAGLK